MLTDMVRRVDLEMGHPVGDSMFQEPAYDLACNPTISRLPLDRSGSGSAAGLGRDEPTINPSLLTVHRKFEEVGDNVSYIVGDSWDEANR